VSLGRQEESHSSSCRRADLLTVSCDQVHKLALLKQTCLTARCGLLLLRRVMTPTCYSCTKLESAACSSLRHVDIRRRHAACNLKSALNTSMHHDFRQCNSLMRLLCYRCPEADFVHPVPFLRELAPPCTLSERRSRDRETTVNPAGIWSTRLWRNSPINCFLSAFGNVQLSAFVFSHVLWPPPAMMLRRRGLTDIRTHRGMKD